MLESSTKAPIQLKELTAKILSLHQQCQAEPALALFSACAIGNLLLQIKAALSGQEWQIWLKDCCSFSEAIAQTYMQVAVGDYRLPARKQTPEYLPDFAGENSDRLTAEKETLVITPAIIMEELPEENDTINARVETEDISPKSTPKLAENNSQDLVVEPEDNDLDVLTDRRDDRSSIATPKPEENSNKTLVFYIPGNVVPKARPRVTSKGTYLPPRYRQWRNMAEVEICRQLLDMNLKEKLPIKKAAISLSFCGKHRTNSDLDNMAGACLDALTLNGAGVLKDDRLSCIPQLKVEYIAGGEETGVWITIEPID
ncbi:MAG: RusA family crossover junction endodeoxyribonuclease [Okeania sp. SIO2H7]|nr:RusA family crossover junction endodeoxyribonuclease [Okeania sp. SIO2H7]